MEPFDTKFFVCVTMKTKMTAKTISRERRQGSEGRHAGSPPRARVPDDSVTAIGPRRQRLGRAGENLAFLKRQLLKSKAVQKVAVPLAVARRFHASDTRLAKKRAANRAPVVKRVLPVAFPDFTPTVKPPVPGGGA